MYKNFWRIIALTLITLLAVMSVLAQDGTVATTGTTTPETTPTPVPTPILPAGYQLQGVGFEYQGWNNCGPATITNALSFYGYANNQTRAAQWLKPNGEDKNVSPWQMVEFVNTQVSELPVFAINRNGRRTPRTFSGLIRP